MAPTDPGSCEDGSVVGRVVGRIKCMPARFRSALPPRCSRLRKEAPRYRLLSRPVGDAAVASTRDATALAPESPPREPVTTPSLRLEVAAPGRFRSCRSVRRACDAVARRGDAASFRDNRGSRTSSRVAYQLLRFLSNSVYFRAAGRVLGACPPLERALRMRRQASRRVPLSPTNLSTGQEHVLSR